MYQLTAAQLKLSSECAALCEIIYRHSITRDESVAEVVQALQVVAEKVEYLEVAECSTEAYLVLKNDVAYLAFRGSESPLDWANNFIINLEPFANFGHCHSGFKNALNQSRGKILKALESAIANGAQKIVLSGHSLGGAMAMMYYAAIKQENIQLPITNLITFGQPRVGNKTLIDWLSSHDAQILRYVNEGDNVPNVPPPLGKHNWAHAGQVIEFDKSGNQKEPSEEKEEAIWKQIFETLIAIYQAHREHKAKDAIAEASGHHDIKRYRKNIEGLQSGPSELVKQLQEPSL